MKLGGADNAFDAIVNTIKHTADNTTLPVRRQFCQTRSVLTLHDLILSLLTELFTFHTRGCVLTTGCIAFVAVSPSYPEREPNARGPKSSTSKTLSNQTALQGFIASLDDQSVRKCLQRHDSGKAIDRQTLLECGDFSLYAEHQRIPEQYAVGHFENILKNSYSIKSLRAQLQDRPDYFVPTVRTQ